MASGLSEFEFRDSFFKLHDAEFDEGGDNEEDEEKEEDEVEEEDQKGYPEGDAELNEAKEYLSKHKMYDHLAKVLVNIFDFRPRDAVDIFEALSLEAKKQTSSDSEESLSQPETNTQTSLAQIQKKLYKQAPEGEEEAQPEGQPGIGSMYENYYYFEQAGVGLHSEEWFKVYLAIKNLVAEKSVEGARYWGKIFGLEQNYFIVEADSGEAEEDDGDEEEEEEEAEEEEDAVDIDEEEEEEVVPLPKIEYKPPPEAPAEESGTGANKKIYYVCNDPGKLWTRLPDVTPRQITVAKKITKFFTGRLDAPVISYPPFPGNEINYLRAQIARISAATQISPLNYFSAEEGDEGSPSASAPNEEYEPQSIREQFKLALEGWVHHVEYILPQGRCTWWNPATESEEQEEADDEEEPKKERPKLVPQVGPPLLTSIKEDNKIHGLTPWTIGLPSIISPNDGVIAVHSNLWVGAHAIYTGKAFENVYIGWGVKNAIQGYNPPMPTFSAVEYAAGPDLVEVNDPTVEEEFPKELNEMEEEEEEEDEEGEDEDDDENDKDEDEESDEN